jgi:hypothetical protein
MKFLRRLLGGRPKRYAVEVDEGFTHTLDMVGVRVRESWENADGTSVFILESQHDICAAIERIPGVRNIKAM